MEYLGKAILFLVKAVTYVLLAVIAIIGALIIWIIIRVIYVCGIKGYDKWTQDQAEFRANLKSRL